METEENKKLSAEHSIEIIRETIEQSRKVITRNCAITLLTWGILICVTATVIGLLWSYTNSYYCNLGWIVMVFIGLLINSKMIIEEETAGVPKSFINDITKNIWRTFAVVIFTSTVASQVTNFGNDPYSPRTADICHDKHLHDFCGHNDRHRAEKRDNIVVRLQWFICQHKSSP